MARLVVDLAALQANYQRFCALAGRPAGAVVKADAYGLGAAAVAGALAEAGCEDFFVALAQEGAALRSALPNARLFVFEGAHEHNVDTLLSHRLIPVVNHAEQLACWRSHAHDPIAVHVDTGIGRLGFSPDVEPNVFAGFEICLLMTHLACADEPDDPHNRRQLDAFAQAAARFPGVPTSIGNSAGIRLGADYCGDVPRPGIGLYGSGAGAGSAATLTLDCVATLQGRVLQVREHPPATPLGYGASYTTARTVQIATIGMGYADGVPRLLSNVGAMAVHGVRCPVVGRVSMDLTLLDVSAVAVQTGDWAECFGPTVSVDEVADWAQTISYEVLTGVGARVRRHYVAAS